MKCKYASLLIIITAVITQTSCTSMKTADLILLNGKIITVNGNFEICGGVAIAGNKIVATGTTGEMRKMAGTGTKIIDLHGKSVIPGLIDSHLHPESASVSELEEEIPDVHSIAQLLGWIRKSAESRPAGSWIIMPKFFPTRLIEMRQPTLAELDSASPSHPVFLNGSFGGMINSTAMRVSGITPATVHKGILKDPKTGSPTGFIRSSAFGLLKIPEQKALTYGEREDALCAMLRRYNEYGLTSLVSGQGDPESVKMYMDMESKKILTARISQNILLASGWDSTLESPREKLKQYPWVTGDGDEWVRIGQLKVYLDGGILTGTAFMEEPWGINAAGIFGIGDPSYRGVVNFTRDQLLSVVSAANEFNWSFTAHATGEAAVDMLLDVYGVVNGQKPIKDKKFSIIHGNFFNEGAIRKMAELGVYAIIQPAWYYKDADAMNSILGSEKLKIFHPYRKLTDAGVVINGGSDHMVKWDATTSINPYNPFLAMWTMVTRKTERGSVFDPEQALTREEALKAYTINNARATSEESVKGSIEPGKLADLAVLSNDLLTCAPDSIKAIKSLMTILDGKIIYTSPSPF